MFFEFTDDALVIAALDKLDAVGVPTLELHRGEDFPSEAVLMTAEQYRKLLHLIPEGEEATALVMAHEHVTGDA